MTISIINIIHEATTIIMIIIIIYIIYTIIYNYFNLNSGSFFLTTFIFLLACASSVQVALFRGCVGAIAGGVGAGGAMAGGAMAGGVGAGQDIYYILNELLPFF